MCMEVRDLRTENADLRKALSCVQHKARLMAVTWAIGVYEAPWLDILGNSDRYSFCEGCNRAVVPNGRCRCGWEATDE